MLVAIPVPMLIAPMMLDLSARRLASATSATKTKSRV